MRKALQMPSLFFFLPFSFRSVFFDSDFLTLFRMGGQGGGGKKVPPTRFSSLTSANIGINPKNFLKFSFNAFATLV